MLDGAGLGRVQGVGLLKAVATLVQRRFVQVAVPVQCLDRAGGADDKVFVAFKLDQWVLSWQGKCQREEEKEKGLHGWATISEWMRTCPLELLLKVVQVMRREYTWTQTKIYVLSNAIPALSVLSKLHIITS